MLNHYLSGMFPILSPDLLCKTRSNSLSYFDILILDIVRNRGIRNIWKNLKIKSDELPEFIMWVVKSYFAPLLWGIQTHKPFFCIVFLETQLKASRDKGIFSKPDQLLELSRIIEHACSDDETDIEANNEGDPRNGIPCIVRRLEWRSEKLRYLCILLDAYIHRRKASIPRSVGKQTGRPPRTRIRQKDAPLSNIPPPPGLPVDCYCSSWLQNTKHKDPQAYNKLEVNPVPILDELIMVLEGLWEAFHIRWYFTILNTCYFSVVYPDIFQSLNMYL